MHQGNALINTIEKEKKMCMIYHKWHVILDTIIKGIFFINSEVLIVKHQMIQQKENPE